jgi:hypothetical protein
MLNEILSRRFSVIKVARTKNIFPGVSFKSKLSGGGIYSIFIG